MFLSQRLNNQKVNTNSSAANWMDVLFTGPELQQAFAFRHALDLPYENGYEDSIFEHEMDQVRAFRKAIRTYVEVAEDKQAA